MINIFFQLLLRRNDTSYSDTFHNDTQHNNTQHSVSCAECPLFYCYAEGRLSEWGYAEWRYVKCRYDECYGVIFYYVWHVSKSQHLNESLREMEAEGQFFLYFVVTYNLDK
jgi:hypothetical protein